MGQKVNPHGLRVGIIKGWDTQWYADKKDFGAYLKEDYDIRKYVKDTYYAAAISKVTIERAAGKIAVTIYTARPGVLIGKAGAEIVAESIAAQLEKRASFRRSMKQAISRSMKSGVKGIKVRGSGRLDGAEIARCEQYHEGSIPLQTLRADIDYGIATAHTTFGAIGIKVWLYKGEVLGAVKKTEGGEA